MLIKIEPMVDKLCSDRLFAIKIEHKDHLHDFINMI